jgi:hypothetical protein
MRRLLVAALLFREYNEKNDVKFGALEKLFETRVAALEKSIIVALASAEKAVLKAEGASENRFQAVNEFRGQLADQTATLLPRREFEAMMKSLADRVDILSAGAQSRAGRDGGISSAWAALLGIAALVSTCVAVAAVLPNFVK